MAPSIELLSTTLGISLIGMSLLNILYGLTCAQTFSYFQLHSKGDRLWIKATAASLWVVNTAHVAFVMHMQYYYLISSSGNPAMLEHDIWSLPASGLALGLISCQVYIFYIWRIWILGRKIMPCIVIGCTSIGHLVMTAVFTILALTKYTQLSSILGGEITVYLKLAAAFGTTTDIMITLYMCWLLAKSRTGHQITDTTINKIMAYTINTGFLATLGIFACLISDIAWPTSSLSIFFTFLIAPLETNAFLGSLNGRTFFVRHGDQKSNRLPPRSSSSLASRAHRIQVRVETTTDAFQMNGTVISHDHKISELLQDRKPLSNA